MCTRVGDEGILLSWINKDPHFYCPRKYSDKFVLPVTKMYKEEDEIPCIVCYSPVRLSCNPIYTVTPY